MVKCPICNIDSISGNELELHIENVHINTGNTNQKLKFKCDQCNNEYTTKGNLNAHVTQKHNPNPISYKCDICNISYTIKSHLSAHIRNKHNPNPISYKCTHCNNEYQSNDSLKTHIKLKHTENPKKYKCKLCDNEYSDPGTLGNHIKRAHKETGEYKCTECDKVFDKEIKLQDHKRNVHTNKLFTCEICNSSFKSTSKLTRHIDSVHKKTTQVQCSICTHVLSDAHNLKKHMDMVHLNNFKTYECELCLKCFKSPYDLEKHANQIHNPIPIKCDKCDKILKSKYSLYSHIYAAHVEEDNLKDCGLCEKRFKTHGELRSHMSNIHDIGNLQCETCLKNVSGLINHNHSDGKTYNICKACYRKAIGRTDRPEYIMSKYLDIHFGKEFLLASDSIIKGDACLKYRPDKLYASSNKVIQIECDEYEHLRKGNDYTCDEKRITEIYSEFPGKDYIVIRWNPHKYKHEIHKNISINERLELLLKCINTVINTDFGTKISIIYMFYSTENPLISKNIKSFMVYDETDLDRQFSNV